VKRAGSIPCFFGSNVSKKGRLIRENQSLFHEFRTVSMQKGIDSVSRKKGHLDRFTTGIFHVITLISGFGKLGFEKRVGGEGLSVT
jgi:hypothetical protein